MIKLEFKTRGKIITRYEVFSNVTCCYDGNYMITHVLTGHCYQHQPTHKQFLYCQLEFSFK